MYQLDFKLLCYFFEININTSFIKSVFISLLDYYDFNFIDQYLSFTNLTKQINILILSIFEFEIESRVVITNKNYIININSKDKLITSLSFGTILLNRFQMF